jgi:hypothetical protein
LAGELPLVVNAESGVKAWGNEPGDKDATIRRQIPGVRGAVAVTLIRVERRGV